MKTALNAHEKKQSWSNSERNINTAIILPNNSKGTPFLYQVVALGNQEPVSRKSRNSSGAFKVTQFSLYLQNEASQGTKLCSYLHFYSIYNICTHSFQNRILPMPFRDFRETGLRTLCISDVCTVIFLLSSIDVIDVTASEEDKNNDSVSIQVKTTTTCSQGGV